MKNMMDISSSLLKKGSNHQSHQYQPEVQSDETAKYVNYIFRELLSACPSWNHRFERNAAELKALKQSYLKGLVEAGLSDLSVIQVGIRYARQSENDFFPSVGKFISWCRSDDFQNVFDAFMAGTKAKSQFERLVFTDAVHANVKSKPVEAAERSFKRIFDKWVKRFSAGDIPQEVPALPSRSVVMPTDIARERAGKPDPNQFRKGSVFARIAQLGQGG